MERQGPDSVFRGLLVLVEELTVGSWRVIILVRDDGGLGQGVALRGGEKRSDEIFSLVTII